MKRISKSFGSNLLLSVLLLMLCCAVVPAQRKRLLQQKKAAAQPVAAPVESSATTPQSTAAQDTPNRPKPLPLANPRLQAIVLDQFLPRIALTPEQTNKVRQIRVQHIRRMRTLLELERAQTRLYDDSLFDPHVEAKEVEKRTAQLAEARTDLLKAQAQFFLDLRQILTAEQITKLRDLMEEARTLKKNAP